MAMKLKQPRFALPATVQKCDPATLPADTELRYFGTVYIHTPTKILFSFFTRGGRWDSSIGIITTNGCFVRWVTKDPTSGKYIEHYGIAKISCLDNQSVVQYTDKRSLWNTFDKWLQTQPTV